MFYKLLILSDCRFLTAESHEILDRNKGTANVFRSLNLIDIYVFIIHISNKTFLVGGAAV